MNKTVELNFEGSKPKSTLKSASTLLTRLYPQITVEQIKELDSYYDRNYLISTNGHEKYVFKITNSVDSSAAGFIEGQNQMIHYLAARGFQVPVPIANFEQKFVSRENLDSEKHFAVRLLRFVPGIRLIEAEVTPKLLLECGEYLARLQIGINSGDYSNEVIKNRNHFWRITNAPLIRRYFHVLSPEQQNLVETVLKTFEEKVLAKIGNLAHAYLHHDFSEQNILVSGDQVCGVIDFGEICYGPRVFDLSICIAYTMLSNCQNLDPVLEVPKFILQGFLKHVQLTEEELSVLLLGSAARLSQSLTIGTYTHSTQPGNDYCLATQTKGWKVLHKLMQVNHEELVRQWIREI